jgi:hypothetical protein
MMIRLANLVGSHGDDLRLEPVVLRQQQDLLELQRRLAIAEGLLRVDAALTQQLGRLINENARLQHRIKELEASTA